MDTVTDIKFLQNTVIDLQKGLDCVNSFDLFSGISVQLKDYLDRLLNHTVRIAIVGVTSSGKSTFLNTVLGRKFLPTGIPPSSGRQIVCCKDKHNHTLAEVIFSPESNKKTVRSATNIPNFVSHYGDERENPGNQKQVLEIRCYTGAWRLPENYVLIDTPGLAAYGHEEHERITLQLVVPMVDAILYLTTAKCESDARTLHYIDSVTAQDKPLIIGQNKIDTVEEKLSRDPSKIKSKEQIKHEHYERVQKMLQKAAKPSVKNAPIVQISAKSWESVSKLLDVLKKQITSNEDCRIWRFANQLINIVIDFQERIRISSAKNQEKQEAILLLNDRIHDFVRKEEDLENSFKSICEELSRSVSQAENLAGSLIQSVCNGYSIPLPSGFSAAAQFRRISFYPDHNNIPSEVKTEKLHLEQLLQQMPGEINKGFQAITEKLNSFAKQLNIQEDQLYTKSFSLTSRSTVISDAVDVKPIHHEARRVKQEGFWGGFKRVFTFGTCGYDDIPAYDEQQQFFSPKKFVSNLQRTANDNIPFMNDALEKFAKNVNGALPVIEDHIREEEQKLASLKENISKTIPETVLCPLRQVAEKIILDLKKRFPKEISVHNIEQQETIPAMQQKKSVSCNPFVFSLYQYAVNSSFSYNTRWMKMLCSRLNKTKVKAEVLYFNSSEMEKFKTNFLSPDEDFISATFVDGNKNVFSMGKRQTYDLRFVLLDLSEVGFFERIFVESGAQDFLKKHADTPIVWCMNSAKSMRENLIEAFAEQIRFARNVLSGKKPFCFMSNDRDIYYSALLHGLYFDLPETNSEESRQKFVARYLKTFHLNRDTQMREHLGACLSAFLELTTKSKR